MFCDLGNCETQSAHVPLMAQKAKFRTGSLFQGALVPPPAAPSDSCRPFVPPGSLKLNRRGFRSARRWGGTAPSTSSGFGWTPSWVPSSNSSSPPSSHVATQVSLWLLWSVLICVCFFVLCLFLLMCLRCYSYLLGPHFIGVQGIRASTSAIGGGSNWGSQIRRVRSLATSNSTTNVTLGGDPKGGCPSSGFAG